MFSSSQAAATLCPDRQRIKGTVWSCSPPMISSGVGEAVAGLLVRQGHGPVAVGRVAQHRYPARPAGPRPAPRPRPLPATRPWPAARAPDRCHQGAADRARDCCRRELALRRPLRVGKTTVPTMVAASLARCWMKNSPPRERTRRLRTWRGRRRRWRPARPAACGRRPGGELDRVGGVSFRPICLAGGKLGIPLVGPPVHLRFEVVQLGGGVGLHLGPRAAGTGRGLTDLLPGVLGGQVHVHLAWSMRWRSCSRDSDTAAWAAALASAARCWRSSNFAEKSMGPPR